MNPPNIPAPLFSSKQVVTTPAASANLTQEEIQAALARHFAGDWGQIDPEDREENERSLKNGWELFSVYYSTRRLKFWIITEGDKSVTTVLLPQDY